MLGHGRLSVALALVIAAALARPDLKNHPATKGGINTNSVNAVGASPNPETNHVVHFPGNETPVKEEKEVVSVAPNAEPNSIPVEKPGASEAKTTPAEQPVAAETDTVSAAKTVPAIVPSADAEVPPVFRDDSKLPVHQRYPHAVLFGGTCGGTIIHPKWVLTAGHCTVGDSSTLFTGGRYVLAGTNNSDDGSGVTKKVKKLHIHPLFTVGPYWLNAKTYGIKQVAARWDFLLAELEEPLELDGVTLAAAPLDDARTHAPQTYVGYAGYGTDHHGGYMRSEMHAMNLQVRAEEECSILEQYNKDDMICAKGYAPNFNSACNGDSGSGLVTGDGKLVGIASWVQNDAVECANGNIVVFSRVASAREWVRKITGV